MILVDANLLLYAYDSSSPRHDQARTWLEETLNGDGEVRFGLVTLLAFIRIASNPSVFRKPLDPGEAIEIASTWLEQPHVGVAEPSDSHLSVLAELCRTGQARGPLVMDAHLAALTLEHGAVLQTTDRGFARFPRLKFVDPLA